MTIRSIHACVLLLKITCVYLRGVLLLRIAVKLITKNQFIILPGTRVYHYCLIILFLSMSIGNLARKPGAFDKCDYDRGNTKIMLNDLSWKKTNHIDWISYLNTAYLQA